jgi:hypothetical protein
MVPQSRNRWVGFHAVRERWHLGQYPIRLGFSERMGLGLGAVPLRAVVFRGECRLGVVAKSGLGTGVGRLAL